MKLDRRSDNQKEQKYFGNSKGILTVFILNIIDTTFNILFKTI